MRTLIALIIGLGWIHAQALEISKPEFSFTIADSWTEMDFGGISLGSDTVVYLTKENMESSQSYMAIFSLMHQATTTNPDSLILTGDEIPGLLNNGPKTLGDYTFKTYSYTSTSGDSTNPANNGRYFLLLGSHYLFTVTVTGPSSDALAAAGRDIEESLKTLKLSVTQDAIRSFRLSRMRFGSTRITAFDLLGRNQAAQGHPPRSPVLLWKQSVR